jgi:hypothetical protein
MERLSQDVWYALRGLRRDPMLALTAAVMLGDLHRREYDGVQ